MTPRPPPDGRRPAAPTWAPDDSRATWTPEEGDAAPAEDIDGRYVAGPLLGAGGMGEVRAADDTRLRREVALKTLRSQAPAARDRFLAEAQVTAQLDHPNIVPVHDLGTDGAGRPFLAMKRVRGRSLRQLLGAPDAPGLEARLDIFRKVCDAVAFAHARGVLHRDIKSDNVMVGAFGEVLLMDWGLARPWGDAARRSPVPDGAAPAGVDAPGVEPDPTQSADATLRVDRFEDAAFRTREGQVAGTPGFMSPEQAEGRLAELDPRTDVYSLGAVLYEIVAGRPPFAGPVTQVLDDVRAGRFPPPASVARVPRELDAVVRKAMALRPSDRYLSAVALREDVDAFLARRPLVHVRSTLLERVAKWLERHRASVRTAGVAGAIGVAALLAGLVRYAADVGTALDRAVAEAERATRAEQHAREQLVNARLALADSHTEQGAATAAGIALRDADSIAQGLRMDRRPLDWAMSVHAAESPPPVATCDLHDGAEVVGLAVSRDGERVASLDVSGRLRTWRVAGCEPVSELGLGALDVVSAPAGSDAPDARRARLVLADDGVRGLVMSGTRVLPILAGRAGPPVPLGDARVYRLSVQDDVGFVSLGDGHTVRVPLAGGPATALAGGRPDGAVWWPDAGLQLAISLPGGGELGGAWGPGVAASGFSGPGVIDVDAAPGGRWLLVASAYGHDLLDLAAGVGQGPPAPGCPPDRGDAGSVGAGRQRWCRTDRATVGVQFSADGQVAIATRYDGSVDVDRAADGTTLARIEGDPSGTVQPVAASPDGHTIAVASPGGGVRVHVVPERSSTRLPVRFDDVGHAAAVSHDGRLIAVGDDAGTLWVLDRATGTVLATYRGYAPGIRHLAFRADDRVVLAGLRAGGVALFDLVADAVRVVSIGGRAPAVDWIDAERIAAVSTEGVAFRIDAASGVATRLGTVLPCSNWGGATLPGTTRFAVDGHAQSGERAVVVVDMADGRVVARRATDASRYRVAASPDGHLLVSGTQDGHVEVWDAQTGAVLRSLPADDGPTLGVAWSPDGTLVASTGFDGQVDLWDAVRWVRLRSIPAHDGPGTAVAFTPTGDAVLTSGSFGARVIPLEAHTRYAAAVAALSGPVAGRAAALAQLGLWARVGAALDAAGAPADPVVGGRTKLAAGQAVRLASAAGADGAWEALVRRWTPPATARSP